MERRNEQDRRSPAWKKYLNEVRTSAGKKGGLTTALRHCAPNPDFAKTRAAKGGTSTLARYGRDYYQFIAQRQKAKVGWPKGKSHKLNRQPFPIQKSNLKHIGETPDGWSVFVGPVTI